jgi:hypothetical protein
MPRSFVYVLHGVKRIEMNGLGRLLQIAGLTIPLLAIFAQLERRITVGQLLTFLIAAMCLFWIGHLIRPRSEG